MIIQVQNLVKQFKVHDKEEGLRGSFKALFARKYKTVTAVEDVSFSIENGELIGFIGPNGAGKTTTLKILSGLLTPSRGQVSVLGFNPFERHSDFLKQISLVMGQKNQLFWDLPPIETFHLNRDIYEIPPKLFDTRLEELVNMLEVTDILHQQVRKLSLGQRMKCELIASLLHAPKILFLDEPTIGLDVVAQKKLRNFVKEYNQKYQSTIILTSHYMGDVQELCERVIIIDKGKIGYDGKLTELIKTHAPNKTITINFNSPVEKSLLSNLGQITAYEPLKITLEVPRDQVRSTATIVLQNFPVDDLDIAETPIEEVIRQVFDH